MTHNGWNRPRSRASLAMTIATLLLLAGGCTQVVRRYEVVVDPPVEDTVDRLLIGDVMMRSELAENLRALCRPGGRVSGTPNAERAEAFIAGRLRDYGLDNVHYEPFSMNSWLDSRTVVTVLGDEPQVLKGALSLGNCLSTPEGGITAELFDVGRGSEADFDALGDELQDKFALVREGGGHRAAKMKWALAKGAVGMVQVSRLDDQARVGQCHPEPSPEPGLVVTGADGKALAERLAAGETIRLNVQIEADAWEATPRNVVGEIPGYGALADEVVIVGAHLDGWHLGEAAIDNGTGSVAILEAARALTHALPAWQPRRTIRFVWFMGEEHGLHGSEAYVEQHADELDSVAAMVNADMPGAPRYFTHAGHPEVEPLLRQLRDDLPGYAMQERIAVTTGYWSDHGPFMRAGVGTLWLSGDMGEGVKYYHAAGDTYEAVDLAATNQAAAVIAVLTRRLADADRRPTERYAPEEE